MMNNTNKKNSALAGAATRTENKTTQNAVAGALIPADDLAGLPCRDLTGAAAALKPEVVIYPFLHYGVLPIVWIDGQALASLNDAGQIAGVKVLDLTGAEPEEGPGEYCGNPNQRTCTLEQYGIDGVWIRAKALLPHFRRSRGSNGTALAACLRTALATPPSENLSSRPPAPRRAVSGWRVIRASKVGKLTTWRLYSPALGELLVILLGTRIWISADSIARFMMAAPRSVIDLTCSLMHLRVENNAIAGADEAAGSSIFIALEAGELLLEADPFGGYAPGWLKSMLARLVLSDEGQKEAGLTVSLFLLHQLLGRHLDFPFWFSDIGWKNRPLNWGPELDLLEEGIDCEIAVTDAAKIAKREGGLAGEIVHAVLADGGYFYGGPINELPNDALIRLREIIPDRRGLMDARRVHEFCNDNRPFETWIGGDVVESTRIDFYEAQDRGMLIEFWPHWSRVQWRDADSIG